MSVHPSRLCAQGAVVLAGTLALSACETTPARTDLRPEGPPELLAVLVMNDPAASLLESATYCAPDDDKRPSLVGLPDFSSYQICPEDISVAVDELDDAAPDLWYVRLMFDELLDPDIEELIEVLDDDGLPTGTFEGSLATTQPVVLECTGVDNAMHPVAYDGYYSPSGNAVTWPLGPSLVIKPIGDVIVPTNSQCQITMKAGAVVDKEGIEVPTRGPFKFKVARAQPIVIDPADSGDDTDPTEVDAIQIYFDNFYAQFNTTIDPNSFCADDGQGFCSSAAPGASFDISPKPADFGVCAADFAACNATADCLPAAPDNTCDFYYVYSLKPFGFTDAEFGFGPINAVETDTEYTFTFVQGTKIKDECGVDSTFPAPTVAQQTRVKFKTNAFAIKSTAPADGDTPAAMRKPTIQFNNVIDFSTLDLTEWTITPKPVIPPDVPNVACTMNSQCAGFRGGGGECVNSLCVTNYATSAGNDGDVIFRGNFESEKDYTFTLNAGAKVSDYYGVEVTNAAEKVVNWKTQPIALTASTTDKSTITKATPTSTSLITLTFNQAMNPASLDATDYTIAPAVTLSAAAAGTAGSTACSASATGCRLQLGAVFTPGDYTFTLKQGAKVADVFGKEYTQAADRVIRFTVKEADTTVIPCLGAP